MKCEGCEYHGIIIEHLAGYQGFDEWRFCEYPLPYYAIPQAVPLGMEHKCKVRTPMNNPALSEPGVGEEVEKNNSLSN